MIFLTIAICILSGVLLGVLLALSMVTSSLIQAEESIKSLKRQLKNLFDLQSGLRSYAQDLAQEVQGNSNAIMALDANKQDKKKKTINKKTNKK